MGERRKLASSDTVAGKDVDFKEKPVGTTVDDMGTKPRESEIVCTMTV